MALENLNQFSLEVADELNKCLGEIPDEHIERFVKDFDNAKRVFFWAPGRVQKMMRCFVRRVSKNNLKTCFIVGDTMTPAIQEGDMLVVGSGAGHNIGLASIAERAKGFGATVALLTIVDESMDQKASNYIVKIPGRTAALGGIGQSIQPGGAKYEQSLFFFLEALAIRLENNNQGNIKEIAQNITKEILEPLKSVPSGDYFNYINDVEAKKETNKVYTFSRDFRAHNLMRCHLMRLMHIGYKAYVYDDACTPQVEKGDSILISDFSGNCELAAIDIKNFTQKGANVYLITSNKDGANTKLAKSVIVIPETDQYKYDHALIVLVDVMIARFIEDSGRGMATGFNLHANLE